MRSRTLLTLGTFDIPHAGHVNFLRQCEQFAEKVIVGVNTDEFVTTYKGHPPLYDYPERAGLISNLGYLIVPNPSAGRETIAMVEPDILAIGSDWSERDYFAQIDIDQTFLVERGISLVYIPYTPIISTTDIRKRVAQCLEHDHAGATA